MYYIYSGYGDVPLERVGFPDIGIRNGINFDNFGKRNSAHFQDFGLKCKVGIHFQKKWYKVGKGTGGIYHADKGFTLTTQNQFIHLHQKYFTNIFQTFLMKFMLLVGQSFSQTKVFTTNVF